MHWPWGWWEKILFTRDMTCGSRILQSATNGLHHYHSSREKYSLAAAVFFEQELSVRRSKQGG